MSECPTNRRVLITGIGGGLGVVAARKFREAGYDVFGCDADGEKIAAAAAEGFTAFTVDLNKANEIDAFLTEVNRLIGSPDVLINNVGIAGAIGMVDELDPDDWQVSLDVNLLAALRCIHRFLPGMRRRRAGTIVNISTVSTRLTPIRRGPYVVSKAALEALTRQVAREAGADNVRCNAIRPGMMNNERLRRVLSNIADRSNKSLAEIEEEQLRYVSMRSMVDMSDVAACILYLASDAARFVTGQVIDVDGGMEWEM